MALKRMCVVAAAFFVLASAPGPRVVSQAQASGCDASDRIDGSSVDTAKKKMETAGFRQVQGLKKSCDNFWHAKAAKDGAMVNIVLSPQGQVITEGN